MGGKPFTGFFLTYPDIFLRPGLTNPINSAILALRISLNKNNMLKRVANLVFTLLIAVSASAQKTDVGVMILAHGAGPEWNNLVIDATKDIAAKYPTEVAFGMALPRTMQGAVDKLEAKGAKKIVVVPLFISSHSFIIRQSEYLVGVRQELADPPMVMDHGPSDAKAAPASTNGHGGHGAAPADHSGHGAAHGAQPASGGHDMHGQSATLERLKLNSEIKFTRPLDDNPLVAQILFERIQELSKAPSKELVVLVGHGPNGEEDNMKWVSDMESLADQIRGLQKKAGKESKMILSMTVRDDADPAIYNQAKENLRNVVKQGSKQGTVIVIPVFLSSGSVEQKVVARLEGLTYTWNGKTLLPDPKISEFIKASVANALK